MVLKLQSFTPLRKVLMCFAAQDLQVAVWLAVSKIAWRRCVRNIIVFYMGSVYRIGVAAPRLAITSCQPIFLILALVIQIPFMKYVKTFL